jgi:hypothetical protein
MSRYGSGVTGEIGGKMMGFGANLSAQDHKGIGALCVIVVVLCAFGIALLCGVQAQFGSRRIVLDAMRTWGTLTVAVSLLLPWGVLVWRARRRWRRRTGSRRAFVAWAAAAVIAVAGADVHSEILRETAYRVWDPSHDRGLQRACRGAFDGRGRLMPGTAAEAAYKADHGFAARTVSLTWCADYLPEATKDSLCRGVFASARPFDTGEGVACHERGRALLANGKSWPSNGSRMSFDATPAEMRDAASRAR